MIHGSGAWSPQPPHSLHVCLDPPAGGWPFSPFPVGPLCPQPQATLPGGPGGPGSLTPAALDGEAEETQLASVTGPALDTGAAGALPSLGVAPVLLGAQRVALAAVTRERHGSEGALGHSQPSYPPAAAGEGGSVRPPPRRWVRHDLRVMPSAHRAHCHGGHVKRLAPSCALGSSLRKCSPHKKKMSMGTYTSWRLYP